MTAIKDWFQALSQREKILIGVMGFLVALVVGYYAIVAPFINAYVSAEKSYVDAVDSQARIEAKVNALTAPADKTVTPVTGPLDVFISQNAGETGFAVGRLDPQTNGTIRLAIDSAKPTALFGWLASLEGRGISVEELSVNPGANDTVVATMLLRSVKPEVGD
ncbi:type II secretion system protein GspM [Parasphingorhabdus cellanae]|uniref:Type II secretion system protein M n=1 Tax=Parasphingorhabdus cellanae TaxID=2806553 RepID=A0ABX7T5S9_9SPHN|nr:type II secretion system protein GspM [Parasphingorhabdus cellanae]QTD55333.1 type II secretion system protein M [Parasphingorhabdus cellanae]